MLNGGEGKLSEKRGIIDRLKRRKKTVCPDCYGKCSSLTLRGEGEHLVPRVGKRDQSGTEEKKKLYRNRIDTKTVLLGKEHVESEGEDQRIRQRKGFSVGTFRPRGNGGRDRWGGFNQASGAYLGREKVCKQGLLGDCGGEEPWAGGRGVAGGVRLVSLYLITRREAPKKKKGGAVAG